MKLLVVNPNTTAAMTEAIVAEVARCAGPGAEVRGVTATFGDAVIASRASFVVGAHAALDACRAHAAGSDAVILACFGDPGLAALREVSPVPVVGLAEASILEAHRRGEPWSIVTAGEAWEPMLRETVALCGAGERLAGIVTMPASGLDVARDRVGFRDRVRAAIDAASGQGARHVILGGAGFAGMAATLDVPVNIIDCIRSATAAAIATSQ